MILWMLEDLDQGKGDLLSRGKVKKPHWQRGKEQEKMVPSHQDKRTRRRFKVSVGIAGKNRVISRRIDGQGPTSATESRTIESSWKWERQVGQRWRKRKGQVGKMLGAPVSEPANWTSSCELGGRRLHRRRKQAPHD